MNNKVLVVALFLTKSLLAVGPAIECRFTALEDDGDVGLDEVVDYALNPMAGVSGDFDPYGFEISVYQNDLTIGIYLDDEPLTGVQIPVINIASLPVGASIFGINTVFHEEVAHFVSIHYECVKTF